MMIGNYKLVIAKNNQKGSILIGIIAAMVLFAAIGTAMLSLTSTATMNQVMANSAARAYYLAESGVRYARWYLDTKETEGQSFEESQNVLNGNDNDKIYTIINGGSFILNIDGTDYIDKTIQSTGTFGTGDYKSVRTIAN